ncbi:unnamed protein product [Sphagnum jensenii]|uniref:CS domain-containing protein n=1 Tax=Sphagnum jensenii TaxID=128206 RepID=A0ABP1B1A4_9BRYO
MDTRMGVEMEWKVVKKGLQFASANPNTKVVEMVSPAPPHAPFAKFKYEWYQTTSLVVICILAKLGLVINLREPLPCMLQLPLFGKVIPAECQYACLKTKLEIKLVKAMNIHWMQLGCSTKYGFDWDKLEAIVKEEVNHPPPIQNTTILNKGSENWAEKYNALEARICELEEKMNAMTLELKEVCQTVLPSSSVPLPTQPSRLGANPKIVAEVARWFFPSWEPLEPTSERATVGTTCGDLETKCESHAYKDPLLPL